VLRKASCFCRLHVVLTILSQLSVHFLNQYKTKRHYLAGLAFLIECLHMNTIADSTMPVRRRAFDIAADTADAYINEDDELVFEGKDVLQLVRLLQ
jgi:hypothetical protein